MSTHTQADTHTQMSDDHTTRCTHRHTHGSALAYAQRATHRCVTRGVLHHNGRRASHTHTHTRHHQHIGHDEVCPGPRSNRELCITSSPRSAQGEGTHAREPPATFIMRCKRMLKDAFCAALTEPPLPPRQSRRCVEAVTGSRPLPLTCHHSFRRRGGGYGERDRRGRRSHCILLLLRLLLLLLPLLLLPLLPARVVRAPVCLGVQGARL